MITSKIALAGAVLAALGWQARPDEPYFALKGESFILKYSATTGEAVLMMAAESEEALSEVLIRDPRGAPMMHFQSRLGVRGTALSGFVLELQETDLSSLLSQCSAGRYDIRARTMSGKTASGGAEVSHEVPSAPVVTFPVEGAVGVPAKGFTVSWVRDHKVARYTVEVEQGENDGLEVKLPPEADHFEIPDGVLKPGVETRVEVGAIGPHGNWTLVEITFTTS